MIWASGFSRLICLEVVPELMREEAGDGSAGDGDEEEGKRVWFFTTKPVKAGCSMTVADDDAEEGADHHCVEEERTEVVARCRRSQTGMIEAAVM